MTVMKNWMMRLWWLSTRTSQLSLQNSRNGSKQRRMRKTGYGKRRSCGGISRLRWDKYPKQRALACQLACCSLLSAMSYLMLNSLDIHVCCKLMEIGLDFSGLYCTWCSKVMGSDWGYTYWLKKENKVVLFKKWAVGLICLSVMLELAGSLPALTHKAGTCQFL